MAHDLADFGIGDLNPSLDPTLAPAVLLGPLIFRALITGDDLDDKTVETLVAYYLAANPA